MTGEGSSSHQKLLFDCEVLGFRMQNGREEMAAVRGWVFTCVRVEGFICRSVSLRLHPFSAQTRSAL